MSINNNCGGRYINFSVIEKAKALKGDGYNLVLHRFKSNGRIYFYIKARKTINGKRKEITVARVSQKEAEELERMGLISKKRGRKSKKDSKKVYKGKSESPNNNTTTSAPPSETNDIKNFADSSGVEPHLGMLKEGLGKFEIGFHNLIFTVNKSVDTSNLREKGFEYNEESKQYVKVFNIMGRRATVFVSRDGNVSVFVGASKNPIGKDEIREFIRGLLGVLSSVFGRGIDARDVVLKSFEFNVDELCDFELPARRFEVSVHMVDGNKIRREIRYSGDMPLVVFMDGLFTSDFFDLRGINVIKNVFSEATDALYCISGAALVDSEDMISRDIVVALDEEQVHNMMLHINRSPRSIPSDYVMHEKVKGVWVKRIVLPVKNLLMRAVEIWASKRSVTIYIKASGCPMGYDDFMKVLGVIEHELYRLYGTVIPHNEINVLRVEYNIDKPVTVAVQDCVVTVRDVEEEYRRYVKEMPDGRMVERVERIEHRRRSLTDFVEEMKIRSDIGDAIKEIKRTLEEVKGSMSTRQIEVGAIVEAVSNRFANILWAMFEKHDSRLELVLRQILKELLDKVEEWVRGYVEHRLRELGYNVNSMGGSNSGNGSSRVMTLDDLPIEFARFLGDLDEAGYVRIMYDKIMYGDKTWQAIRYFRGNIDGFIEEASYEFVDGKRDLRDLFKAVMKAIRFYDNKFNGSVGVPWDRFVSALERFYGKKLEEIEKELRRGL